MTPLPWPEGYDLTRDEIRNIAEGLGLVYCELNDRPCIHDPKLRGGFFCPRKVSEDGQRFGQWAAPRLTRRHDEIRIALGLATYGERHLYQRRPDSTEQRPEDKPQALP